MKSLIWRLGEGVGMDPVSCLDRIIHQAFLQEASDVHIDVGENFSQIKMRIKGGLFYYALCEKFLHLGILGVIKSRAHLRIDIHDRGQDGSFIFYPHHLRVDRKIFVRVSINPTIHGEAVVLRILDQKFDTEKNLDSLGMNSRLMALITEYTELENSLILISGATGSGKTTTMYSIINFLNPENLVIISLEDPVEKHIPNVRQIPIRSLNGFSYAEALRVALRQDPDVIVIGEIRDKETAQIAIEAALTGHLIIGGIHAKGSVDVVSRLKNLGVDEFMISQTLSLSIHQKMIYPKGDEKTYVEFSYIDFFKHRKGESVAKLKSLIKNGNV